MRSAYLIFSTSICDGWTNTSFTPTGAVRLGEEFKSKAAASEFHVIVMLTCAYLSAGNQAG